MGKPSDKLQTLTISIGISVLVHLLVFFSIGRFGSYSFAAPAGPLQAVMVDVAQPADVLPPAADNDSRTTARRHHNAEQLPVERVSEPDAITEKGTVEAEPATTETYDTASLNRTGEPERIQQPEPSPHTVTPPPPPHPPVRGSSRFLSSKREKLSFLVSLRGVPVGNMELEARHEKGELRIQLRTRSNSALSDIYAVDNSMETRHIGDSIIITKIRQREGSLRSDTGFTIFQQDKRVFWFDRTRNRYSNETIPNSDVLDTLSALYRLRKLPLRTGTSEILHMYDGEIYAPVPVEVVRQEQVLLRNFKKVDTLLLRHLHQKNGIFKRAGDMLIWVTHDDNRVPVKLETTTPLGTVTVELVSAESQLFDSSDMQALLPQISNSAATGAP